MNRLKIIEQVLKVGHPLNNVGVHNWALTKEQALNALEQFWASNIALLGGDVYEERDGTIQSNYDSWYCNQLPDENDYDFVSRSIARAKEYIKEYKGKDSKRTYFVLICKS